MIQLLVHVNVKLVSLGLNVIKNVTLDCLVLVAYKHVFAKMEPIVMSNLEHVNVKLVGMVHIARNLVLMATGVTNVTKFVLVPKTDQNVIMCQVNVNVVLVIMEITVMNYVPLVLLGGAAQRYACVVLDHMTVTQSMAVASASLVTLVLCATKNAQVVNGVRIA